MRAVAIRNDWTIVSLTQLTRNYSMGCADIDITAISESHGLVQTVDCLLGLIQTVQMKLSGLYYIKALACRNSAHGGDRKSFKFEGDYMRITEDASEDIIPEGIPLPAALTIGAPSGGNDTNQPKWNRSQRASVLRRHAAAPVHRAFSRSSGCQISAYRFEDNEDRSSVQ